jgi:hypothetical protein
LRLLPNRDGNHCPTRAVLHRSNQLDDMPGADTD